MLTAGVTTSKRASLARESVSASKVTRTSPISRSENVEVAARPPDSKTTTLARTFLRKARAWASSPPFASRAAA
jgi:hypothetical protein